MKINLWYCQSMKEWRWTLCEEIHDDAMSFIQESGNRVFLRDAMDDISSTVEYIMECKQN